MADSDSIGAFICYLYVSPFSGMDLFKLADNRQTLLEQDMQKALHNIDVARIQIFTRTQDCEEARRKLERNVATCEQNLAKIMERITTVETDRATWIDQADYLDIVKANLLEHANQDAEWEDLVRQSDDELRDCQKNIAADDEILEAIRTTYELWRDKKGCQHNDIDRKRENFERRRARWQAQLDRALKNAEVFKKELALVAEKIQGTN